LFGPNRRIFGAEFSFFWPSRHPNMIVSGCLFSRARREITTGDEERNFMSAEEYFSQIDEIVKKIEQTQRPADRSRGTADGSFPPAFPK
jgi:hypothetical protein